MLKRQSKKMMNIIGEEIMNKKQFLDELEQLLKDNKVNNTYTILKEYSNKIDSLLKDSDDFNKIIKEIKTPNEIIKDYIESSTKKDNYDNDEQVYEKNKDQFTYDYSFSEYVNNNFDNKQFSESFFSKINENKKAINTILIILIIILLLKLLLSLTFSFFSFGFGLLSGFGFFEIALIFLVVYFIYKNNQK